MKLLVTLFGWPNGIVVGNLIASILWATPAFIAQHMLLKRHINKKHEELHKKLDN